MESCYLGQCSVTLGLQRTIQKIHDDTFDEVGPPLEMFKWNTRKPRSKVVEALVQEVDGGRLLKRAAFKHAVFIAVNEDVVEHSKLAPYGSSEFPDIVFKKDTGNYILVNGGHRWTAVKVINQSLISEYENAVQILKKFHNASGSIQDDDGEDGKVVSDLLESIDGLREAIHDNCSFAAILLDYGESLL